MKQSEHLTTGHTGKNYKGSGNAGKGASSAICDAAMLLAVLITVVFHV